MYSLVRLSLVSLSAVTAMSLGCTFYSPIFMSDSERQERRVEYQRRIIRQHREETRRLAELQQRREAETKQLQDKARVENINANPDGIRALAQTDRERRDTFRQPAHEFLTHLRQEEPEMAPAFCRSDANTVNSQTQRKRDRVCAAVRSLCGVQGDGRRASTRTSVATVTTPEKLNPIQEVHEIELKDMSKPNQD